MQISKHKNHKVPNAFDHENYKAPKDQESGQLKAIVSK